MSHLVAGGNIKEISHFKVIEKWAINHQNKQLVVYLALVMEVDFSSVLLALMCKFLRFQQATFLDLKAILAL